MADILIVDDDADASALLGIVLETEGHTVRVAHDGQRGLAEIERRFPALVVLDIEMPVLDGPGMALELRRRGEGREAIPILLSSGHPAIAQVARRIGTPHWLPKPSGIDAILAAVARALTPVARRLPAAA